jgi:hypothetical protein
MTYNNYRRFKVYLFGVVDVDFVPCYACARCKAQMRNVRAEWRIMSDKMRVDIQNTAYLRVR